MQEMGSLVKPRSPAPLVSNQHVSGRFYMEAVALVTSEIVANIIDHIFQCAQASLIATFNAIVECLPEPRDVFVDGLQQLYVPIAKVILFGFVHAIVTDPGSEG